jgi:hypothetical protein
VPIGQFSPVTMKKIRVVHVRDGYDKRAIVKDVIWQAIRLRGFPPRREQPRSLRDVNIRQE